MKKSVNKLIVLCCFSLIGISISKAVTINDFLDLSYTNPRNSKTMKYRLFVPKGYDKNKSYPLVGFLHGAGEGDINNVKQVTVNDGCTFWADDSVQNKYPSFVLAPNSYNYGPWAGAYWFDGNFDQDKVTLSESLENYINIIKVLQTQYSIDASRIYSTGLSMGGGGTWASITRYPNLFAAAIPICGYGDPNKMTLVKSLPIWTFHGSNDGIISVQTTRALVAGLKTAGSTVVKYTEIAGGGHGVWDYVYKTKGLGVVDWLFSQKRTDVISSNIDASISLKKISLFPNPTKDLVDIYFPSDVNLLQLVDVKGNVLREVFPSTASNLPHIFELGQFPSGIYTIIGIGKELYKEKLLIE